jgi:hypothetical protein
MPLLHELPSMTPESMTVAKHIAATPLTVYLPLNSLRARAEPYVAHYLKAVRLELVCAFAAEGPSKITDWLRADQSAQ